MIYDLVEATSLNELVIAVNLRLKTDPGAKLQGGVSISSYVLRNEREGFDEPYFCYAQAITIPE